MRRIAGTRIETFTHPERGPVLAALTDRAGAFLTVDASGVPTVYGPDALPTDPKGDLAAMFESAVARKDRRVDWSKNLSDGLSFFGLFRPGEDSFVESAARAAAARAQQRAGQAGPALAAELRNEISLALRNALAPLMAAMDADALRALRAVSSFTAAEFGFYARGDGSAASMERRKRRLQAADAYPLLAGAMARNLRTKLAIDRSAPLNEEMIQAFGQNRKQEPVIGKALLRRLQGLDWPVPEGVTPEWLAERVGELPADWFPKTPEEWDAFMTVARGLGRNLPQRLGMSFADLVKNCGGKWVDFRKRLAKAYTDARPPEGMDEAERTEWLRNPPKPDESYEALNNAAIGLADMVEAYARLVVLPAAGLANPDNKPFLAEPQRNAARHAAAELLFGGKNAAAMFEISRHYHTQAERVLEAATGHQPAARVEFKEVAEDGWAPLCNQVQAPNGVWVMPLTDPRELQDEGRHGKNADGSHGLHHCVGGYSEACKTRGHHILSFRYIDEEGRISRQSTIEIDAIAEGDRKFKVCQHQGKGNGKIPDASREAWEWFQEAVWTEQVRLNYEGIRTYMVTQRTRRDDDVERVCGYKWREEGAFETALGAFSEWMPKGLRGLPAAEFLALPEVQAASDAIMPRHRALAPSGPA